jgi:hypothetical protein
MSPQDTEMLQVSSEPIREVLEFSQFRLKLLEFFKLPLNVSELALCEVLKKSSQRVFEIYLARAKRAQMKQGAVEVS